MQKAPTAVDKMEEGDRKKSQNGEVESVGLVFVLVTLTRITSALHQCN